MKRMADKESVSCDDSPYSTDSETESKRVQWADDLVEIHYFAQPHDFRKSFRKKIRKIKEKAGELTDKPLKIITNVGEVSATIFQHGLEFISKHHGPHGSFDTDLVTYEELEREWDRLFKLYAVPTKQEKSPTNESNGKKN
ncbi:predicted protein [Nematostella vectensis]|uniref:Uncharacterized protein n=1 Tax=Nematostella vectensis TaxID=45351 RepID=A7SLY5_NEMVE|nr:predicted protein [Nematostella vectensis]|eukprot:XP_001627366.1 predicted protein [Nematostella vectensis]